MTRTKRRITPLLVWLALTAACGGSSSQHTSNEAEYVEAGVVAGIAGVAAVVQTARNQAQPVKSAAECCAVCDKCSFPCGNSCLPIGSVCLKPKGCACYDTQLPIQDRPPRSDLPCPLSPGNGAPDAVVVPGIIVY